MRWWRRAQLALVAASLAAGAVAACSSFGSTSGDTATDGGLADATSTADASEGGGVDSGPLVRFCATQSATALICDDFEENDGGVSTAWMRDADGGTVVAADAPMRTGHAAQMTATGPDGSHATLSFTFPAATAIAGVVFDVDMLLQTAGYDYIELVELHTVGATVDSWGVAKSGLQLGMHYTPHNGPQINVDGAWHHVHVELTRGNGAAGFHQMTMIDTTVVEDTQTDLSSVTFASISIGAINTLAGPGTPVAVLFYDNALLRAK